MRDLDPRLFGYIWRHSKRDHLAICFVVLASLPFYFASLDLPRRIVNDAITGKAFDHGNDTASFLEVTVHWPTWLGGDGSVYRVFEGFQLGRSELLLGLSLTFLGLVLINGAFKFYINLTKGILGERMLRRLRFQLFSLMLRFTPEAMREVKSSETATIIRDEVEPIGTFIGDAVVVPAFLGTQAATALAFILMQNVWLGLVAGGIVAVQILVIPHLRREIIRLSRRRQLASRSFAGRVGEVLDGLETVTVNDAGRWERAEIGGRLYSLFDLRLKIYKRKFLVKYLNNLLAQVTPFLFYAIGGMFALRGQLDIGQLVAVLAAYRDLPPPLKELIDWDQQRLDVEVKYETVAAHFAPRRLRPDTAAEPSVRPLGTPLQSSVVSLYEPHGGAPIEIADFTVTLPAQLALISQDGQASRIFGRVLAGLAYPRNGTVSIGGSDLTALPQPTRARRIAYAGPDPTLFPGTIRGNILYGLRPQPVEVGVHTDSDVRRLFEARVSGNPVETVDDPWIDFAALGVADMAGLDARILGLLERLGLGEDLYRFGLTMRSVVRHDTPLGRRVIAARAHLRSHFAMGGMANLVIPFDRERYNPQATVSENLLFGVPRVAALVGRSLAGEPRFRAALAEANLLDDLAQMGVSIGRNLVEIFRDVPVDHPLFRQFSTIVPEELPEFERRLVGLGEVGTLSPADAEAFLALTLSYIEPRQRFGLLDQTLISRLVSARTPVRLALQGPDVDDVEPYDPRLINSRSCILDNLLFGRIDTAQMHGEAFIQKEVRAVVRELNLETAIRLRGLDYEIGNRGRNLTLRQQVLTDLVRAIVRQPEILVVDGALDHLDGRAEALSAIVAEALPDATYISIVTSRADAAAAATTVDLSPHDAARR